MLDYVSQARRRLALERDRLRLRVGVDDRPLAPDAALRDLPSDGQVLFLCLGNICRSPLAERYAADQIESADADISVVSAGFVEREDRSSPDTAVDVADEFGVDLSDHGSTHVTRELVEESDLIFLMDVDNYRRLRQQFPDAVEKAYLLHAVREDGGVEIPDPVHGDHETFREVYADVAAAVDRALARAGVGP